jgi:hypothetical protein
MDLLPKIPDSAYVYKLEAAALTKDKLCAQIHQDEELL